MTFSKVHIILRCGIAQFVGSWLSESEDFRVDLWEKGKGFILHLDHEYHYLLDSEQREALVPSISRYERDRFLDTYYSLFGPMDHFVRTTGRTRDL
jgi:hypothetical protein